MTVPLIASCSGRAALMPMRGGRDKQAWATADCECHLVEILSYYSRVCSLSGVGEAQSSTETTSRWSEELSSHSKSLCGAGPHCGPRPLYCSWPCTNTWCTQTRAPCPTPQEVSSNLHQIYLITTLKGYFTYLYHFSPSSRPNPKQPPTLPKPCIVANIKYRSWDCGRKGHCCDKTLKNLHYENWKP